MKLFTEKDLQKYIQQEVEKICIAENLIKVVNPIKIDEPIVNTKNITFESSQSNVSEIDKIEIEDVKLLAEELSRMKNLVDFRSPLLKRD